MTCNAYELQIGDYVDGTLDRAATEALERHLAGCASCQALAADFGTLRAAASTLERHYPSDRTWTRIAEAVEGERRRRWIVPRGMGGWQTAAAAALVVAVGVGSWAGWRAMTPAQPPQAAASRAADPNLAQSVETELRLAEEHYEKAIAGLEQITRSDDGTLDPQTASVLQTNLTVIDQAIGESRAALEAQPASELAQESLFEALRSKVSLLQDTVSLINEMRKGNQEGAARIVSGIDQ